MNTRPIDDTVALDRIHAILDAQVWSPDTLDDIAAIIASTGREIRDPVDLYPEDCDDED